jgi:Taurine catabolism dioxygenase TauD, TfdA family
VTDSTFAGKTMSDLAEDVEFHGFTRIAGPFRTFHEADQVSRSLVDACRWRNGLSPLSIIGDFVVPPLEGDETRDFQTLHFDFGLPVDPKIEQEVALYTALYVPANVAGVQAVTRLVPLLALLGQRSWPPPREMVDRLTSYGRTHGSWDDGRGYTEGSLARIIEGADAWSSPVLPSVKTEPTFLCGLEFDSLFAELAFFERHLLRIDDVEISIDLQPGELLVLDNLAVAHGRRGARKPGELRQRMFGHSLEPAAQRKLRDEVLAAFYKGRSEGASTSASMP